uniref:Ubiquitin-like-conjugating enzyme ATG10 n=2 Tax=Parascaris univalens TaxID=6257 RepID=A0A914ZZ89_PARUN
MSGTISEEEFLRDISEIAENSDDSTRTEHRWTLVKHDHGVFCKNSSTIEYNNEAIVRHFHVTYSQSYGVPVLWFNFYRRDGSSLHLDDIVATVRADFRSAIESDLIRSISQNEHPYLGIMFYHIHPCRTHLVMRDIRSSNYVLSWLSIFGSPLRLSLPSKMFQHTRRSESAGDIQ